MKRNMKKSGISLISLIIMIIVIVIIVGAVILSLFNMDILESSKQAKFMNNFRAIEEGILLYMTSNVDSLMESDVTNTEENNKEIVEIASTEEIEILSLEASEEEKIKRKYPVTGPFTAEERQTIKNTTLATEILQKTGKESVTEVNTLWWVDLEKIGADIKGKKYLLDIETMQVYEYEGEKIREKMWHTLDGGIGEVIKEGRTEEIWDGYKKRSKSKNKL